MGLMALGSSLAVRKVYAQVISDIPAPLHMPPAGNEKPGAVWLTLPPTPELPKAGRSGTVKVGVSEIYFAEFGSGPPVLLLHGGLANSNYWGHQVAELAPLFTVIVMDTRGHGRSPMASQPFGYNAFAKDVLGLLDYLKIAEASIVGWSDGAVTGLQLAMTHPDRVTRLFAFGGNSAPAGYRHDGAHNPLFKRFASRCRAEYRRLSPTPEKWTQLLDGLRSMWRTEPAFTRQKLALVSVPTMISAGEHDEIIRREDTEYLAHEIPGARLAIQPEVSHFAMLQNTAQFNETLTNFLISG